MQGRVLIAVLSAVFLGSFSLAQEQRKTPKRPDQPFTVFVYTEGLKNDDVDMPKVAKEVAKRIGKKKWLKVVKTHDDADIVVEVLTHLVNEQHRTRIDSRVNVGGVGKTYYDSNFVTERHRIETRVTLPDRRQKLLTGADDREQGGSMKGAASNLAGQLEDHCKENYWRFVGS